jgi:Ca2+-binding EF-hand superfamily protein
MFTITIQLDKSKDVLQLLESLPKNSWVQISSEVTDKTEGNKPSMNGVTCLTMTGKKAQLGSMREQVLTAFEKLEKKHKIGNVTRTMLREDCDKKDLDSQIIYQLIRDGYLGAL